MLNDGCENFQEGFHAFLFAQKILIYTNKILPNTLIFIRLKTTTTTTAMMMMMEESEKRMMGGERRKE
jgi:hypothetical protein